MRALLSGLLIAGLASSASALTHQNQRADGGVTLRSNVSTGVVVDPGDAVSFQYQSARDGAVVVFDIDTRGNVSLLTDEPVTLRAHDTHNLPDDGSELFAEGQPGVEFVFAVAVDDPSSLDSEAIASLRDGSRQITGDPFIAANMIASEVVRNISQETVFIGYTYFYVSDRVDYPCYLCGNCDGTGKNECEGYHIAQNFDRNISLAYPLARGYDMVDTAANPTVEDTSGDTVAMPNNQDEVNFYPYGTDIHYADPIAMNAWYNWGYYDPYYYYYPYSYPYCGYPYGFSVGIGWGWGGWWGFGWGWGGYYCGGYYNPYYGCGGYGGYYPGYGNGYYSGNVVKYKSQYKGSNTTNTLASNRTYAMKRDGNLQVASKSTKSWNSTTTYRSKTTSGYAANGSRKVKTSVSGGRAIAGRTWADGRSKSYSGKYSGATVYRSRPSSSGMYKNNGNAGRTVMDRGGHTRSGSTYNNGSTRMKSGGSYNRSNSSWNGGRSSGSTMRGNSGSYKSAPAMRGGSSGGWGGSRGGYSGGSRGGFSGGGGARGGFSGGHGGGKGR